MWQDFGPDVPYLSSNFNACAPLPETRRLESYHVPYGVHGVPPEDSYFPKKLEVIEEDTDGTLVQAHFSYERCSRLLRSTFLLYPVRNLVQVPLFIYE